MKKSIDINLLVYCNSILYTSHWPGSSFSKPLQTTARITLTLLFTCQWPHYIKVYLNEAVLITFNVFIHGWRTFNRTSLYLIPKYKYLLHMHAWQILLHASVAMKNQLYMRYNKNEWIYWSSLSKRSPISKSLNGNATSDSNTAIRKHGKTKVINGKHNIWNAIMQILRC